MNKQDIGQNDHRPIPMKSAEKAKLSIVCPITNANNKFPLHIPLDNRTKTTGVILCEHIKALDLNSRTYEEVEKLPNDILKQVIDVVYAEIEQI